VKVAPWLAALGVTLAAGCAHRAPGPADALVEFSGAVARGDLPAAYAMTSRRFRARVPFPAFADMVTAPDRKRAIAELPGAAARQPARAEVSVGGDDQLSLVLEDGWWRLDDVPAGSFGQATPRAAMRSFLAAIAHKRWDVLLRLAPASVRERLSPQALAAHWDADPQGKGGGRQGQEQQARARKLHRIAVALDTGVPFVTIEDEAALTFGDGEEVRLVREDGAWCILGL
jgi:hypothetical protein